MSVVLCVYDDWKPLEDCLGSLALQKEAPSFEVVVVDDGSSVTLPKSLGLDFPFPLRIIRQAHEGPAAARNTGMRAAIGSVFVFTDADCILDAHCLGNLAKEIEAHHDSSCFQLCLIGDCSHLVGRAEELHLSTVQRHMVKPSGHISYLNTAGAAIRRDRTAPDGEVFDVHALRGQDTMLFADMIRSGEYPRFVPSAIVLHNVRLHISKYLWKGLWTGYVEGRTYQVIKARGTNIRSTGSDRIQMLSSMWKKCLLHSWGPYPFFIVTARQSLCFVGTLVYQWFNRTPDITSSRSGLRKV
jgi:glycosyltransferase involved in cell wall biosynthesis